MLDISLKDTSLLRQQSYVGGTWVGSPQIAVKDPATGETLASVPDLGAEETRSGRSAEQYLRAARIVPRERFELNALNAIAVMVDRGLGVSLVPDWAPPWPDGLKIERLPLPQAKPIVARRIGIVWSLSTVRTRLVRTLREECERAFPKIQKRD